MAKFSEMEEAFKLFVNNLPQFFWLADSTGNIVWLSQSWHDYTGISVMDVDGDGWIAASHPDQFKKITSSFRKSISTESAWEETFLIKSKSDSYRWFLTNAVPLYDENKKLQRWLGINTDITNLKNTEKELLKSETRYKLATLATQDVVYDWNLSTNEVSWNEAIKTKLKYEHFPKKTRINWWKERIHPYERDEVVSDLLGSIKSGQDTWRAEYRFLRGNGEYANILERGHVARNNSGEPVRMIGAMTDVTAERHAVASLRNAKLSAEQANLAKSRFLANMSHEIRTPLSAMLGFVELMRSEDLDSATKNQFLDIITRNGEQLLRIMDDVLDLSRVEAGKFSIDHVPVNLEETLSDVSNLMKPSASKKGIQFKTLMESKVPKVVYSDPVRLKQIILNMVGNAIKFTDEGEVKCEFTHHQDYLCIRVTDTGIGIATEQQTKIFEPFQQADDSIARYFGGTGLGLSLTRKISQAMGGDFYLKSSKLSEGSCFEAKVYAPKSKKTMDEVIDDENINLDGCRVLIIDDSVDNRILFYELLRPTGAIVHLAEGGREALKLVSENDYDVILLDIQMPEMDGYEVLSTLHRLGIKTPTVALTAHAMKEERDKALTHGFDSFITKPIESKKLHYIISKLRGEIHAESSEKSGEKGVHHGTPEI